MRFNLKGRVANFDLPVSKALHPLFEAVVNSIHAIDEKYPNHPEMGEIKIDVLRYSDQVIMELEKDGIIQPVVGFVIQDNGIGFNEDNYTSFDTSDSTYKLQLGGKGVGRFCWLKAFDNILVESVYGEGNKKKCKFDFTVENGITNSTFSDVDETIETYSKVVLEGFKSKYQRVCPKRLDVIASKIIEHCLSFFVLGACPNIVINDANSSIALLDVYKENIDASSDVDFFKLGDYEFQIKHIKVFSSEALPHRIHWCANQREVIAKPIDKIANLTKRLVQDEKEFSYSAYVSGQYLDQNVNTERTNFYGFGSEENGALSSEVTWKGIADEVYKKIKTYLLPFLEPIREEKLEKVKDYISRSAPEYKQLWLENREEIDESIPPEAISETQIDLALYKIKQNRVIRNKSEAKKLLDEKIEDIKDTAEYLARYQKVIGAVSDDGRSDLARYIVQRRVIIDLLKKSLQLQNNGEYCYEEVIHNIIMPKHYTSDELAEDGHNLWLIDEKLAYQYFIASDVPFNQLKSITCDSEDQADLLVLNHPAAFVEGEYPFGSITIIEFKRPNRSAYSKDDNPVDQVLGYVKKLRQGYAYDKNGECIIISGTTPFYCYIICDLKPPVREDLQLNDFTETPDGEGFFRFHRQYNAYIEVIPYRKMVSDAEKRNRALFKHLHLS